MVMRLYFMNGTNFSNKYMDSGEKKFEFVLRVFERWHSVIMDNFSSVSSHLPLQTRCFGQGLLAYMGKFFRQEGGGGVKIKKKEKNPAACGRY